MFRSLFFALLFFVSFAAQAQVNSFEAFLSDFTNAVEQQDADALDVLSTPHLLDYSVGPGYTTNTTAAKKTVLNIDQLNDDYAPLFAPEILAAILEGQVFENRQRYGGNTSTLSIETEDGGFVLLVFTAVEGEWKWTGIDSAGC